MTARQLNTEEISELKHIPVNAEVTIRAMGTTQTIYPKVPGENANYGTQVNPNWYIEGYTVGANRYVYWKQDGDGGEIEQVLVFENIHFEDLITAQAAIDEYHGHDAWTDAEVRDSLEAREVAFKARLAHNLLDEAEHAKAIMSELEEWPENEWYTLSIHWQLNLWRDDDENGHHMKYASILPVVWNGRDSYTDTQHPTRILEAPLMEEYVALDHTGRSIITVSAETLKGAATTIREQLDRPGRREYFGSWKDGGEQIMTRAAYNLKMTADRAERQRGNR